MIDSSTPLSSDQSWLQGLQTAWTSFYDTQIAPAWGVVVPFLATLGALLVVTRLAVAVVTRWAPADDPASADEAAGSRRRSLILAAGVTGLLMGAATSTLGLADLASAPLSAGLAIGVFAGSALTAALLLVLAPRLPHGSYRLPRRAAAVEQPASTDGSAVPIDQVGWPGPALLKRAGEIIAVLTLLGACLRFFPGDSSPAWLDMCGVAALALTTAGVGVVLSAWWVATRLRIQITVTGPEDKEVNADVGALVAQLSEIGTAHPRGLEVPRAPSVTALDDVLTVLPQGPFADVVRAIGRTIVGVTPWTVGVEGNGAQRSVAVSRNGRTVTSVLIADSAIPDVVAQIEDGEPAQHAASGAGASATDAATSSAATAARDTLALAAAVILTTVARYHLSVSQDLPGRLSWRSVGYQYLASLRMDDPKEKARRGALLAAALNEDRDNAVAELAWQLHLHRESKDADELEAYATWLDGFAKLPDGQSGDLPPSRKTLRLRAMYTRTAVGINAFFARAGGAEADPALSTAGSPRIAKTELEGLFDALDRASREPMVPGAMTTEFANVCDYVQEAVPCFRLLVQPSSTKLPVVRSTRGCYSLACSLASRHDVPWNRPDSNAARKQQAIDDNRAVGLFLAACQMDRYQRFLTSDPQLAAFRTREGYRRAFLTAPRTDLMAIEPLSTFAAALKANGLVEPGIIASSNPEELALVLGTTTPVAAHLIDVCALHESLRSLLLVPQDPGAPTARPLSRWAVELLAELEKRGLASTPALIRRTPAERATAAEEVAKAALERCSPGKDEVVPDVDTLLATYVQEWIALVVA